MKTISTDTRTLAPGAKGDGSFTEKNFPLEGRKTGKSCEISRESNQIQFPQHSLWMEAHISHISYVIGASILFAPPTCTDVLSQRVCLLWTVEAGQKAAQSELRPGTVTVSASQKRLAAVLEGE